MTLRLALTAGLILLPASFQPTLVRTAPAAAPSVVEVKMVDKGGGQWRFEPATIQANPGDLIRFVQSDIVPHNVEFKKHPEGAQLGAAKMGPFLIKMGDVYDLNLDERFVPGDYVLSCTPHEMMGMTAALTISTKLPAEGDPR